MSDPYEPMFFVIGMIVGVILSGFSTYMFCHSSIESQYQYCNKQCVTYVTEKDELLKCVNRCVKARNVIEQE